MLAGYPAYTTLMLLHWLLVTVNTEYVLCVNIHMQVLFIFASVLINKFHTQKFILLQKKKNKQKIES